MRLHRLAALALPLVGGCLTPAQAPLPEWAAACQETQCACRGKVHVVFLNGFDPLDVGRLTPLRHNLDRLGFKTHYGHCYHLEHFAADIARRRQADPELRVVVIGQGLGVGPAYDLAARLGQSEVDVAALIGLDIGPWEPGERAAPANVGRVRLIRRSELAWSGETGTSEITDVAGAGFSSLASYAPAVQSVVEELVVQAARVPYTAAKPAELCFAEPVTSPREVVEAPADASWDYLRPMAQLPPVGTPAGSERTSLRPGQ